MNDACAEICKNDETLEEKLACICHELDLALKWKRPSLLFAIYDTEAVRRTAQDSLEDLILKSGQTVVHYQIEYEKSLDLVQFVNKISQKDQDVFYINPLKNGENESQVENLISILNSCRGFLVDHLVRVVFWLTQDEALKVAHKAPDFWASRHRVFEFFKDLVKSTDTSVKRVILVNKGNGNIPVTAKTSMSDLNLQVESPFVFEVPDENEPTFSGINLLLMLGVANWKEGNLEKASEPLQAALSIAEKSGNIAHQVMCHKALALVKSDSGRIEEAINAYQRVNDLGAENVTIWNNLGTLYSKAGRSNEALQAFENAIKMDPNDPVSWNGVGAIYSNNGRLDEAINCFRKAIKLNAGFIAPWIQLADVLARQNRVDDSLYAYMRIVEMDKKNVHAWSEIGSIYLKAGSFEQSIDAYKKALMLGDTSPLVHKNLAYAHTQAGYYAEAIPLFLHAIESESDNNEKAALGNMLGDVYRRVGDYENAVAAYELADKQSITLSEIAKSPAGPGAGIASTTLGNQSNSFESSTTPVTDNSIFEGLWRSSNAEGLSSGAGLDLNASGDQAFELTTANLTKVENSEAKPEKEVFHTLQPSNSQKLKSDIPAAEKTANPHAVLANSKLLTRLAKTYLKVGAEDKAIEAFQKALVLDPTNGQAVFELGQLFSKKNDLAKAISYYEMSVEALTSSQEKAQALNLIGDLYRQLKDYSNALEAYETAFGLDPNNETVMGNLGKIQEDLDQLIEAETPQPVEQSKTTQQVSDPQPILTVGNGSQTDQPIKIDLNSPDVWNELGNIYAKSNALDEAVEAYQKAIALNPEFGWSYSNLALVFAIQGQRKEAVSLLEKSIGLLWTEKDKAMAWNRMGDILRQASQYPDAIAAYQNADKLNQVQHSGCIAREDNFIQLFSHFVS